MKKIIALSFLLFSSTLVSSYATCDSTTEQEALKQFVNEYYIDALANNADFAKIDQGFHTDFMLFGVRNDELWTWTLEQWKDNLKTKKENGEFPRRGKNKFSADIVSVDINGLLAVVKLKLYRGGKYVFIDYLTLYKLDGNWKLISKTYHKVAQDTNKKS
ncbi:Putative lumazine-binding [Alteromonadaceae bacterium Bs31]|nr:Putative lumazine-binding [Alteromonadaceae bacterium Bs31]